ncbi:MAG: YiiX/YebB-like N1pC/P60 family cysteine hydrolase [Akkermansiaceae bacterium]|nr:YiiX/YebB-like N1pC/P60 family cysteine hydrolase [Akkermansiaceae bacterium]
MFRYIALLLVCNGIAAGGLFSFKKRGPQYERLQTGDIVFQDTGGEQGAAVKAATGSNYTHCGVVFEQDGKLYVLEAVQPVSVVTLENFRKRSRIFHARRLQDQGKLNQKALHKALNWGRSQIGKDYDLMFQWDDETLYCSELVWKIYKKSTGLELCQPKTFKSYFLDRPEVRRVIAQRYGDPDKMPAKEPVVAPSDLAASPLLEEVPRR